MCLTSSFMSLHTAIPDLRRFQPVKNRLRKGGESVDFYGVHGYNYGMETSSLQVGKTRYTHYSIAYHLAWIPTYRRQILTREAQPETKVLIAACCKPQVLPLLSLA